MLLPSLYFQVLLNTHIYIINLIGFFSFLICNVKIKYISVEGIYLRVLNGKATISMNYQEFSRKNLKSERSIDIAVGKTLKQSVEKLYNNPLFIKYHISTIYTETHENLAYELVKYIAKKWGVAIEENQWNKIIQDEGLLINDIKMQVTKSKNRINELMTTRYPWNASKDQMEKALKPRQHYRISVPAQLFQMESKK